MSFEFSRDSLSRRACSFNADQGQLSGIYNNDIGYVVSDFDVYDARGGVAASEFIASYQVQEYKNTVPSGTNNPILPKVMKSISFQGTPIIVLIPGTFNIIDLIKSSPITFREIIRVSSANPNSFGFFPMRGGVALFTFVQTIFPFNTPDLLLSLKLATNSKIGVCNLKTSLDILSVSNPQIVFLSDVLSNFSWDHRFLDWSYPRSQLKFTPSECNNIVNKPEAGIYQHSLNNQDSLMLSSFQNLTAREILDISPKGCSNVLHLISSSESDIRVYPSLS